MLGLDEERFIRVCAAVVDVVRELHADSIGDNKIRVDFQILAECYVRAEATAALFNADDGINYYREAGQYCYWLRKLKPVSIHRIEKAPQSILHVNEFVAYFVAAEVISFSHSFAFNALKSRNDQTAYELNSEANVRNNLHAERMEHRIVNSLRYYVHSAGSLPTMLEALFGLPLDDEFAYS